MVDTIRSGAVSIGHRLTSPGGTQHDAANQFLRPFKIHKPTEQLSVRRYYEMLEMYAANVALYDAMLQREWERGESMGDVRGLMTPANAIVQYYASTIWPGSLPDALPITSEDEDELELLRLANWATWDASNWSKNKQVCVRMGIRLGDVYLKACQRASDGHPYIQIIHPWYVTDFETNERDNMTFIRLDMPQEEVNNGGRRLIETEVWDKDEGVYRFWRHYNSLEEDLAKLGAPDIEQSLGEGPNDLGFDFIPFVHIKARDTGEKYGQPPYLPALDKIDELNMIATDLNDDLFRHNKAKFAISANAVDAEGRPMMPPGMFDGDGELEIIVKDVRGEEIFVMPGMSAIQALGSGIDWSAKSARIDDTYEYLAKQDLPELKWYTLGEGSALSGVALRRTMSPAISTTIEARGNFETGLVSVQQMCMTLGQLAGIDVYTQLSIWADGGLRHSFSERDVIPLSEDEAADTDLKRQQANALMINNGYTVKYVITNKDDLSETEYDEMLLSEQRELGPSVEDDLAAINARAEQALSTSGGVPVVAPSRPGEVAGQ